ncbi:unnamed protein product [Rotaria sp. Silwood2]|nr:unnamed protein product [Rotaria sp. Silwood2]
MEIEIEKKRDHADWLLRNILPEHVIEPLRQLGGSYPRNHDTVNVASRMDSTGLQGQIQVPEHVALALKDQYKIELRGEIDLKGKSRTTIYFHFGID